MQIKSSSYTSECLMKGGRTKCLSTHLYITHPQIELGLQSKTCLIKLKTWHDLPELVQPLPFTLLFFYTHTASLQIGSHLAVHTILNFRSSLRRLLYVQVFIGTPSAFYGIITADTDTCGVFSIKYRH